MRWWGRTGVLLAVGCGAGEVEVRLSLADPDAAVVVGDTFSVVAEVRSAEGQAPPRRSVGLRWSLDGESLSGCPGEPGEDGTATCTVRAEEAGTRVVAVAALDRNAVVIGGDALSVEVAAEPPSAGVAILSLATDPLCGRIAPVGDAVTATAEVQVPSGDVATVRWAWTFDGEVACSEEIALSATGEVGSSCVPDAAGDFRLRVEVEGSAGSDAVEVGWTAGAGTPGCAFLQPVDEGRSAEVEAGPELPFEVEIHTGGVQTATFAWRATEPSGDWAAGWRALPGTWDDETAHASWWWVVPRPGEWTVEGEVRSGSSVLASCHVQLVATAPPEVSILLPDGVRLPAAGGGTLLAALSDADSLNDDLEVRWSADAGAVDLGGGWLDGDLAMLELPAGALDAGTHWIRVEATDPDGHAARDEVEVEVADCTAESGSLDEDGDGFGAGIPVVLCASSAAAPAPEDGDCDDADPDVHPGAEERCDTLADDDCDGERNEGCATVEVPLDASSYAARVVAEDALCMQSGEYRCDLALGDPDGDGTLDFAVGSGTGNYADSDDLDDRGAAWVFFGSLSGEVSVRDSAFAIAGDRAEDLHVGQVLALDGDLDGDGYDDLVSASPFTGSPEVPYVALFHMPAHGVVQVDDADLVIESDSEDWDFGFEVIAGTDATGDGLDDCS